VTNDRGHEKRRRHQREHEDDAARAPQSPAPDEADPEDGQARNSSVTGRSVVAASAMEAATSTITRSVHLMRRE